MTLTKMQLKLELYEKRTGKKPIAIFIPQKAFVWFTTEVLRGSCKSPQFNGIYVYRKMSTLRRDHYDGEYINKDNILVIED